MYYFCAADGFMFEVGSSYSRYNKLLFTDNTQTINYFTGDATESENVVWAAQKC